MPAHPRRGSHPTRPDLFTLGTIEDLEIGIRWKCANFAESMIDDVARPAKDTVFPVTWS
jgi:hypothetical protein